MPSGVTHLRFTNSERQSPNSIDTWRWVAAFPMLGERKTVTTGLIMQAIAVESQDAATTEQIIEWLEGPEGERWSKAQSGVGWNRELFQVFPVECDCQDGDDFDHVYCDAMRLFHYKQEGRNSGYATYILGDGSGYNEYRLSYKLEELDKDVDYL